METSQTSKKSWLWLAIIILLFIVFGVFFASSQPKEYPDYVSESPAPSGTKALYTYLGKEYATKRWDHTPELLSQDDRGHLLFMIEPMFVPDSTEMRQYVKYMKAGNTVLLLKNNPDGMFNIQTNLVMADDESITVEDESGNTFESSVQSSSRLEVEETDNILLEDEDGVIALERPIGEGHLVVANSPDWLTNELITEKDHLELLFSLLPSDGINSPVLFDEYIHVSGNETSFFSLYPKWMLLLGLQLIILTLLWLWYKGKRFGPVRIPREATVRFSNEQRTAIAAWYQRGYRYQDSLKLQADYVKLLLQEKWFIPYRKSWLESSAQMAREIEWISNRDMQHFTEGLTDLLNKNSISKQEYVAWSKKLDKLQREVEEK